MTNTDAEVQTLMACPAWAEAYHIQEEALRVFFERSREVLGPACGLRPLDRSWLSVKRNLFSTLFISASSVLGLEPKRCRFYALINQCVRALVTGCDNLLDDEFKEVIPFDLGRGGTTFRSVLTVMVADRVLGDLALEELASRRLTIAQAKALTNNVLAVLIPSGIQEHEEEIGSDSPAPPEFILEDVHRRKTGMLFQAPVHLLVHLREIEAEKALPIAEALYRYGLACQALDDIKDAATDLAHRNHNLLVSTAWHGEDEEERKRVADWLADGQYALEEADLSDTLPLARAACLRLSEQFFRKAESILVEWIPSFGIEQAAALRRLVRTRILSGIPLFPLGQEVWNPRR